jgi:protein gp37
MNDVRKSIGWCDYTLNPIIGCKRHCWYCSSAIIFNRFKKKIWQLNKGNFDNICFYPKVLQQAQKKLDKLPPSKIFIDIMTDNEYWPIEYWKVIYEFAKYNPNHTFMLLSKSVKGYAKTFYHLYNNRPDNLWYGLTISKYTHEEYRAVNRLEYWKNTFLSVEPIQGPFNRTCRNVDLVIVGAMTQMGGSNIIPKKEWIDSIKRFVPEEKIFWKENIKQYL